MALVRNMLVQIARDYSREGAAKKICWEKHDADVAAGRTATPGPVSPQGPDRGGRELSLVATVTSIAEAFGHRDTHHEAAIAGFRFLASNEAFGRMALFAAPAAIGPLKGRQNTCRDLADRIKAHADAARIRTFDAIPGVLAQAAVIWTQVCADVAAHVEQVEAQILRAKDAVPPLADPRREAQEVQEALLPGRARSPPRRVRLGSHPPAQRATSHRSRSKDRNCSTSNRSECRTDPSDTGRRSAQSP
jgi:hypothetical protein